MTPEQASTANFLNSVAEYVAQKILDKGYLVYWHVLDAVQTPDGWYYEYSTNTATYLADATFAARAAAAKGMVSIVPAIPAEPRFVSRPTVDGTVLEASQIAIPAVSFLLGPPQATSRYQLGSGDHWRERRLTVDFYARTEFEQRQWQDWLATWFDHDVHLEIREHDNAGAVLADTWCRLTGIDSNTVLNRAEAEAFQVVLTTFLEYIA